VVGSKVGAKFDDIRGHNLDSDRVIFVAPGIKATDAASKKEVTLPGAYTAAALAGMLSARDPHISLTISSFCRSVGNQIYAAAIGAINPKSGVGCGRATRRWNTRR